MLSEVDQAVSIAIQACTPVDTAAVGPDKASVPQRMLMQTGDVVQVSCLPCSGFRTLSVSLSKSFISSLPN